MRPNNIFSKVWNYGQAIGKIKIFLNSYLRRVAFFRLYSILSSDLMLA